MIAEYDVGTGGLEVEYVYAGGRMIAREQGSSRVYFLHDRLSVRAVITDGGSGGIVGRQGHLPFGEEIGGSGTTDKHKFTSYERDPESGLDYAVNRGYSPSVGRFMQADPYRASGGAEYPQSWNRYAYVHNTPTDAVDPLGLFMSTTWGLDGFHPCDGSVLGSLLCLPLVPFQGSRSGFEALPKRCSITIRTGGDQLSDINLSETTHHNLSGHPKSLGEGISQGQSPGNQPNSYWFFFLEVQVTLPSDDLDPNNWVPFQSSTRTGSVIIENMLGRRRGRQIEIPLDAEFPGDTPDPPFTDTSSSGFYYWVDAPDFPHIYSDTLDDGTEVSGPVVSLHVRRRLLFMLNNKRNPLKSCAASLELTLDVDSQGNPNWAVR